MKIIIEGQLDGFPVRFEAEPGEVMPDPGFVRFCVDAMLTEGVSPRTTQARPQASNQQQQRYGNGNNNGGYNRQSNSSGYQRNGNGYGQQRSNQAPPSDWQCPVHGNEAVGPGYQGRGTECKVRTTDPEQDDPNGEWVYVDQDGNLKPRNIQGVTWFYCRYKSR